MRSLEALLACFAPAQWLALGSIDENPRNPRLALDLAKSFVESFATGFRIEEGYILAFPYTDKKGEKRFLILSGHRRIAAMRQAKSDGKLAAEHQRAYAACFTSDTPLTPDEEATILAYGNAQTNKGKKALNYSELLIMALQLSAEYINTASETAIGLSLGLDRKSSSFAVISTAKLAKAASAAGCRVELLADLRSQAVVVPTPSAERVAAIRAWTDVAKENLHGVLYKYLAQQDTDTDNTKALGKTKLAEAAKACPSQYMADVYKSIAGGIAPEVSPLQGRLLDLVNRMSTDERKATEEHIIKTYPHHAPKTETNAHAAAVAVESIAAHTEKKGEKNKKGK
jgi:hypothetical protein